MADPNGQVYINQPEAPATQGPLPATAGGSAAGSGKDDNLEGEISNAYPVDSAPAPDAGVTSADAGPDAQAPVVGGP